MNINLNNKKSYFIIYTATFLVMCVAVFFWFLKDNRTFVYIEDGIQQYYPTLMYWGFYLRSIFFNFIHGNFSVPLYSFSLGYGADIITTLHYYVFGDPLDLLYFFVPRRFTEYLYDFLIIFRLYLAGIAFSIYAFSMIKSNKNLSDKSQFAFPVLIGSFIYIFSGYGLLFVSTPFFLNPLIYLPLLLLGIEKIFKGEKPYLFIILVGVSLLSNFYFFYLLSETMLIYIVIRMIFSIINKDNLVSRGGGGAHFIYQFV